MDEDADTIPTQGRGRSQEDDMREQGKKDERRPSEDQTGHEGSGKKGRAYSKYMIVGNFIRSLFKYATDPRRRESHTAMTSIRPDGGVDGAQDNKETENLSPGKFILAQKKAANQEYEWDDIYSAEA